ncbi:Imm32 family immunity protein [Nocardia vinacea]|uniref:Imm32 family immunity protein n=1 Tax=Nocardia vinacea TaxID=96468 RepID=UPI003F4CE869
MRHGESARPCPIPYFCPNCTPARRNWPRCCRRERYEGRGVRRRHGRCQRFCGEFEGLAAVVARGEGRFETEDLAAVEVRSDADPRLLVQVVEQRRVLLLAGDRESRALLAQDLRGVGSMMDGGHQHIEYYEDFGYLRKGSAPLVLNSPHGGMPQP